MENALFMHLCSSKISRGLRFSLFFIVFLTCLTNLSATHNRAGEITYEQIGELTIRATIVTYTRTSSQAADRDSLTLHWGDGDSTFVRRTNGNGFELPNDIKRNIYVAVHTYPTRGTYTMSVVDPNRIAGILNIDFPNSVNIKFYIETTFTLLEPRFQGVNNSAVLLQPPIDIACVGRPYTYNPNAYEKDGDSLSFELVTPLADNNLEVPNYQLPDQINSGTDNMISLDPITGDFVWNSPQTQGEYNITYLIKEYREGVLINSILRDMQILVRACIDNNTPPQIDTPTEICVIAGEVVTIDLLASDIDSNEILSITASGGPFELDQDKAVLFVENALPNSMLNGKIIWETTCEHISNEFYQIVVRTTDEISRPMSALATLKTVRIKVVGPPPENLQAENINNIVTLTWDKPYVCEDALLFQGFSVWRRVGSSNVTIDICNPGLEGQGFEKVVFLTDEMEDGSYIARDAEIDPGNIYCYRVVAEYAQITEQGNLYNRVQSITSDEACIRSSGENPLITKVSVIETDEINGTIEINWLNPDTANIDTTILTGPYRISVDGGDGLTGQSLVELERYEYPTGTFGQITDTIFINSLINTREVGRSYQVQFLSGMDMSDSFVASSGIASSVFLQAGGNDESVLLTWTENVPWNNFKYFIYEIADNGNEVLIDSTSMQSLRVEGLTNGISSCFKIISFGTYGISEVPYPLINMSNEACATPQDNEPPCQPSQITISSLCDQATISDSDDLINTVNWSFTGGACTEDKDIKSFGIYFAQDDDSGLIKIDEVDREIRLYEHRLDENIAGCYAISAIDSSGNESTLSQVQCIDNCPTYVLPNTFTPNNDNANDLFVPRLNRFIDRIELNIYNRWGQKVFETSNPEINWDGKNLQSKDLAEGTYYYECKVFENRVSGISQVEGLKGTIQLIR